MLIKVLRKRSGFHGSQTWKKGIRIIDATYGKLLNTLLNTGEDGISSFHVFARAPGLVPWFDPPMLHH